MYQKIVSGVQRALWRMAVLLVAVFCVGCASSPKSDSMTVVYIADHGINPDLNGRASPVAITFYRLRDSAAFESADYMTLMEREEEFLGDSFLSKERVILRPGETQEHSYPLNGEERAYGIVAGYRSIDTGGWKLVGELPKARSGFLKTLRYSQARHKKTIVIGKKALQASANAPSNE